MRKRFDDEGLNSDKRWQAFVEGYQELKSAAKIENYFFTAKFKKTLYKKMADDVEGAYHLFRGLGVTKRTRIRPDVFVKGPDYANRKCCGSTLVESYGGRVMIPVWPVQDSSTQLVDRTKMLAAAGHTAARPQAVCGSPGRFAKPRARVMRVQSPCLPQVRLLQAVRSPIRPRLPLTNDHRVRL